MARYSAFLGSFVDVQYRAGDICLPASGTFVADSGRSIFLEQHYEQHGQPQKFSLGNSLSMHRSPGRVGNVWHRRIGPARATARIFRRLGPRVASQCSARLCRCFPASHFSAHQDCLTCSLPDRKTAVAKRLTRRSSSRRFRAECVSAWTFRADTRKPTQRL